MPCNCQNGLRSGAVCGDCNGTTFIQQKVQESVLQKISKKVKGR